MTEDPCVCFCMGVHRGTLVEAIARGADTLEALKQGTRAGTACATCRIDLLALLTAHAPRQGADPSPGPAPPPPLLE